MGMILTATLTRHFKQPCPHTHGDDPFGFNAPELIKNLSPHAWG